MKTTKSANATEAFKVKRCFLLALITTIVIELVTLLVLACYWRALRSEVMAPRQEQMCLALDKFTVAADEEATEQCPAGLRTEFDEKKNTTTCCGLLSDVLDNLSSKVVLKKYNGDANPEMSSPELTEYKCSKVQKEQPEANLVGLSPDKNPVQVGVAYKLLWNTATPSYAQAGLRHVKDDGTVYVEKAGTYYISTQLKTKVENANETEDHSETVFRHYVHLISETQKGSMRVIDFTTKVLQGQPFSSISRLYPKKTKKARFILVS